VSVTVAPGVATALLEKRFVLVGSVVDIPLWAGPGCAGRARALPTPTKVKDSATRSRAAATKTEALAIGL